MKLSDHWPNQSTGQSVAEQRLDRSDVGARIEELRRETVPERVQRAAS